MESLHKRGGPSHNLRRNRLKRRCWLLLGLFALQPLRGQIPTEEQLIKPTIPPFQAQVPGTALEQPVDPATYMTGPGDIFLVSIVGIEPYLIQATVTPAQQLIIPQIGSVGVQGLTAAQVRTEVLNKIKAHYPIYEADCTLYGIREIKVSLSGAVVKPGMYNVTPLTRLIALLRQGGGWRPNAALHRLALEREGADLRVDLLHYLQTGDMEANPTLREGDRLVVPFAALDAEMISVGGLAGKPQYFAIRPGEPLSAFLARWYKPANLADLSHLVVRRKGAGTGEITVAAADYAGLLLQAGDAVYINAIAGVMVVGEVRRPGRYEYYPGYRASEYVVLASGTNAAGASGKLTVTSRNGERRSGSDPIVEAGDTIKVPPSLRSVMVGQAGLVQVALAVLNIYLTYLAATR